MKNPKIIDGFTSSFTMIWVESPKVPFLIQQNAMASSVSALVRFICSIVFIATGIGLNFVSAQVIQLQNGTATLSQVSLDCIDCSPNSAIDGQFFDANGQVNGWSIAAPPRLLDAFSETAVWETGIDVSPNRLVFQLCFNHGNPGHLLGCFRISVTTDDRSTFADSIANGGDVEANWTILMDPVVQLPTGLSFSIWGTSRF